MIHLFKKHGYEEDKYSDIDAGSDCPGIKMVRGGELVEIYLIAPFEGEYRIKVNFKNHDFKIEIPAYEYEKSSLLLEELIDLNFGKDREENE